MYNNLPGFQSNVAPSNYGNIIDRYNQWQESKINEQYLDILSVSKNLVGITEKQFLISIRVLKIAINLNYNHRKSISAYITIPIKKHINKTLSNKIEILGYSLGLDLGLHKFVPELKTIDLSNSPYLGFCLETMINVPIENINRLLKPVGLLLILKTSISNISVMNKRFDISIGIKAINQKLKDNK